MTQSNKRTYAPSRPAGARPAAGQQARRSAGPAPRQSAPAPRRAAPAPSSGGKADLIRLAIGGVIVAVLAFGLQCLWPNGFPIIRNQDSAVAAQSKVSEIYSAGPLRINEVMTGNRSTLSLEDDTSPDWVEVMNTGDRALSLEGYTLSKTADDVRTFTFPAITLDAGECILVYADSRLRDDPNEALHAPFRLSSSGDTLMLFNAGGTAVDTVNIPALNPDQSYARMDTYAYQLCDSPTPSLSNTQESYLALQQPVADSPVVISEIMSTNTSTYADENGHYYDYLELYNRSGAAVDLTGWYLSDDSRNLRKWRIPELSLGAGEYLAIHASKLDRRDDTAHLHTNFGLSSEGEQLLLVSPEGRIMDLVNFDLLKANVAYSLNRDGTWSTAAAPSPGRAN